MRMTAPPRPLLVLVNNTTGSKLCLFVVAAVSAGAVGVGDGVVSAIDVVVVVCVVAAAVIVAVIALVVGVILRTAFNAG